MKKYSETKEYVAPMLSISAIDIMGFICNSVLENEMHVDEGENMGEEEFVVYDN